VLPLAHVIWMIFKPDSANEVVTDIEKLEAPALNFEEAQIMSAASPSPSISPSLHNLAGHFEGKWFVHTFLATYADTNSVGNVYFGMYAMWVGKARELFFNRCLPKFNLKTSAYYILTRSFEHKFVRETREFEQVSVKIRIAKYNRKFATLEHQIFDSSNNLLGKGEQSLMFVSSSDYNLIDMPQEISSTFFTYT
jgi:acyl-CoA thioesterase FadM